MPIPTKDLLLMAAEGYPPLPKPLPPPPAPPPPPDAEPPAEMFERLATDPRVDVDKLKALLDMHERVLDRNNRAAFDSAFAEMQADIPVIFERAKTDKTTYAPLEDIMEAIRPILHKHGFALSFRTEWPDAKTVKVVGILTHREGHHRESEFLSAADQTGSKNAIQALGSAVTYGRRYTTKDLLNITTTDQDDDGERSTLANAPPAPEGFEDWMTDLEAVSYEGTAALMKTWNASRKDYRKYLTTHDKTTWEGLKKRAEAVR